MYLKIVCAWCGKFLGIKSAGVPGIPKLSVTHGICCKCKAQLLEEVEARLEQHHQKTKSL
jgi:hypothetical protein